MAADPDWGEISARSARILAEAHASCTVRSAAKTEIAQALADVVREEIEQVARLDILSDRMRREGAVFPGIAHGVGRSRRRTDLLIELHRRLTDCELSLA